MHDNEVTIKFDGLNSKARWIPQPQMFLHSPYSCIITPGQPSDEAPTMNCTDGKCTLNLKAGRKSSEDVANNFAAMYHTPQYATCHAQEDSGASPKDLNFAFCGTIVTEAKDAFNVRFGQGHFGGHRPLNYNNWHVYFPQGVIKCDGVFSNNHFAVANLMPYHWTHG